MPVWCGVVWALPRSLAATGGIVSAPRPTEMFQFGRFPPGRYGFTAGSHPLPGAGLPHSEIVGSPGAVPSPTLIAATHVLHRHATPRHPPHAPSSLVLPSLVLPSDPHHGTRTLGGHGQRSDRMASLRVHVPSRHSPDSDPSTLRTRRAVSSVGKVLGSSSTRERDHAASTGPPAGSITRTGLLGKPHSIHEPLRSGSMAMVEMRGLEPLTSCVQSRRSPN